MTGRKTHHKLLFFISVICIFYPISQGLTNQTKFDLPVTFVCESLKKRILFQARDGRTIRLFIAEKKGTIQQLSKGPFDVMPMLAPAENAVFYENKDYSDDQESLFQIVKMNLNSHRVFPISDRSANDSGLAISKDGSTIAFSSKPAAGGKRWRLYLMDVNGKNRRPLDPHWDGTSQILPDWSPDGRQVVFVSRRRLNPTEQIQPGLYSIPTLKMFDLESNTSRFVLSENLPAEQPRWAPEGNRIVFTSPDVILKTRSLWIAELSPLRLTQVTRDCNDRFPEWDKDGNHILFSRKNNSRTTICQVNVKTQTVTELFYSETVSLDYPQILRD